MNALRLIIVAVLTGTIAGTIIGMLALLGALSRVFDADFVIKISIGFVIIILLALPRFAYEVIGLYTGSIRFNLLVSITSTTLTWYISIHTFRLVLDAVVGQSLLPAGNALLVGGATAGFAIMWVITIIEITWQYWFPKKRRR